ncbi:hypothetical protein GWI34_34820, partial [Actinomadura sp. DSM 109109]|nr:hypothetical protein [Actinomadura lepetitiana]
PRDDTYTWTTEPPWPPPPNLNPWKDWPASETPPAAPADAQDGLGAEPSPPSPEGEDEGGEGAGGRPAPPAGWYQPYVPEEEPVDKPDVNPRRDAW